MIDDVRSVLGITPQRFEALQGDRTQAIVIAKK
jgi:hypothetical protein